MSNPQDQFGQPDSNQQPAGQNFQQPYGQPQYAQGQGVGTKSKIVAGILGILLGSIGIHNFYLGKNGRGVLQIVLTLVTLGAAGIWGFVEGILILISKPGTTWHQDSQGFELQD
jgi:TM2 domain-containing membrane protein YozV